MALDLNDGLMVNPSKISITSSVIIKHAVASLDIGGFRCFTSNSEAIIHIAEIYVEVIEGWGL